MKFTQKLSQIIYRYLRKFGILPKLKTVINKQPRNIQSKRITYNLRSPYKGETYAIKACLYAPELKKPDLKAAVISLVFYDKDSKPITIDPTHGFSRSNQIGYYKYIPVSRIKKNVGIFFTIPENCKRVKVSIMPWGEKQKDIFLAENANIKIVPSDFNTSKIGISNDFVSALGFKNLVSFKEAKSFVDLSTKKYKIKKELIVEHLFTSLKEQKPYIAKHFGQMHFENTLDKSVYDNVYLTFQKAGDIQNKYNFIKKSTENGIDDHPLRMAKAKEDYQLLQEGFQFSRKQTTKKCSYKPQDNTLYLLHNSLPYNSGGYATRTHGLINNIAEISDFNISGLSRPGFPSDHKRYISYALPSPIPRHRLIDNIQYFTGDQNIRKSRILFSEYITEFTKDIKRLATQKNASIIHAASNYPNGLAAINAARELGIKSAYEVRGLWEITRLSRDPSWEHSDHYKLTSQLEVQALKNADIAFTITNALKDLMIKRGVQRDDIHVIPNAVDVTKFQPIPKDAEVIERLGLENKVVVGYVGSVVEYEGLDDLLLACAKIVAKGIEYFKLLIVGDGAYHDKLKELTEHYKLGEYVIFTGRVPHDEVQKYISVIDVMPFPRKPYLVCETVSPLKPFESLASKKAVIVSSCAALQEIIKNDERGLVFKKGDVDDLVDKLLILINDDATRKRLAENGLKWVRSERDWKIIAKKVADIYAEATAKTIFEKSKCYR